VKCPLAPAQVVIETPCHPVGRGFFFVVRDIAKRAAHDRLCRSATLFDVVPLNGPRSPRSKAIDLYFIFSLVEFFVVGCSSNSGGVGN
jgi:hypothetical protein